MSACCLDQGLRLVEDRDELAKRDVRDYLASSSDADHCTELFAYYEDLHPAQGTVPYCGGGLAAYHHVRFEVQHLQIEDFRICRVHLSLRVLVLESLCDRFSVRA